MMSSKFQKILFLASKVLANISHPVTAAMLVMEDLLNSLSFSLNFLFLLSVPMLAFVAVRYRSQPRIMFLDWKWI